MAARKKRIMRSLKVNEISGVDVPAQVGARVLLMKRAVEEEDETFKNMRLTNSVEGHSHLLDDFEEGGHTSYELTKDADAPHAHPWVRNRDGSVTIGEANGHSHDALAQKVFVEKRSFSAQQRERLAESGAAMSDGSFPIVNVSDLRNAIQAFGRAGNKAAAARHIKRRARALGATNLLPTEGALAIKSAGDPGGGQVPPKEDQKMTDPQKKAAGSEEAVDKAQFDAVQAELATAKAFGELTDAEKSHYKGLDETQQAAFLKMSSGAREEELRKASERDKVVYTDADGNEYRKSDDPRLIASARRADAAVKVAREAEERAQNAEVTEKAETLLKSMPGESATKCALIRAVEGIQEPEMREAVYTVIKAGNDALAKGFKTFGIKPNRSEDGNESAQDELEKMAKEYSKEHKVDIVKARVAVLETDEGQALYAKHRAEKSVPVNS